MVLVSLDYIYIIYILVRVLMRVIFIIFRSLLLYIILCILLSRMEIRTTTGPFDRLLRRDCSFVREN
jgi:hypothetical protein